jgi:3-dehydroquinate synthase
MTEQVIQIAGSKVHYIFDARFATLSRICGRKNTIIVTDETVFANHQEKFGRWQVIVLPAGEAHKQQATVDSLIAQLMAYGADRSTTLVGVGGGVVTDMVGYAAAVYLRGVSVGYVPTTLLAMVDAAIGGKNGVDVGVYKNLVGTIRQPAFLLFDTAFLQSLPLVEWENGFAEIIKHAAIRDKAMFRQLETSDVGIFQKNRKLLNQLIMRNALLKTKVVRKDPNEKGERRLLNFGHTLGHAIENEHGLMHGRAVAIGMVYAGHLSAQRRGFKDTLRLMDTIERYGLPTHVDIDMDKALLNIRMDKKKMRENINFVLLDAIGKAVVESIALRVVDKYFLQ